MQLFFCDGLPVSYPSPDSPDHSPQRTCTTQSPEASGEYPNQEGFYSPSPSLGRTETIHPACRRPSQPPDTISTGAQTYSVPYSAGSAPTMWPTPPATACDDLEDYTYHASPTSGSFGLPDYASSIRSSVDSPRSWPSPEAQHLAYQQSVWETPEPTTPYSMNIAMAMHGEDMQQQLLGSPYGNPTYSLNHMSTDSMAAEAPGITPDYVDSAMSDRGASPLPEGNLKHCYVLNEDKAAPPLDQGGNDSDEDDAGKGEEPYAKLIFKAFLSRANHAMTLQELYQWFRDNTEKVTPNSKGWQNSIRHNLSMNGVCIANLKCCSSRPVLEKKTNQVTGFCQAR